MLCLLAVSGCSSVPDAVNPVEWYRGVSGWIGGDDADSGLPAAPAAEARAPGADQPYPSLSTTPERPEPTSVEQRKRLAEGLAADRARARYSEEQLRRGPASLQSETATASSQSTASAASAEPPRPARPPERQALAPTQPPRPASAPERQARSAEPAPIPPPQSAAPPPPPGLEPVAPPPAGTATMRPPRMTPDAAPPPPPPPSRMASAPQPPSRLPDPPAPPQAVFQPPQQPADVRSVYEAALRESEATTRTVPNGGAAGHDGANGASGGPAPGSFEALLAQTVSMPRQPSVSLQVADIFFAHGSAQLDARDREVLREVVAMHKERGGQIRVIGHASSRTGSMDLAEHKLANFGVSIARADAVAAELVRLGADRSAVLTNARSDHERVYFESMPNGEAGNRRAEIYLDY